MTVVIFGASGQDGVYLNQLLSGLDFEIINISRRGSYLTGDIADYLFVESVIKMHRPEFVFHFAANSTTQHSALFENHASISTGTLNLLESVRLHSPSTRIFLSGSAMQFKNDGIPIDESTPFEAGSAYAAARIQSVYAGRYYREKFGLRVYVGYFFNHDSPLRSEKHINQKIVKAASRIAFGSKEKLVVGNIEVKKEFNFAGDIVESAWKLVNQDEVYEAVMGSGEAHTILEWLDYCFANKNLAWKKYVILQPEFVPDYEILVSNPQLIKCLGWQPKVGFYQLANMMINE
ncbi:MAG: GDP-mannose 4,6-dehydratase [Ferruginibacter sp.]